ncbi:MAG: SRPBCC family protein [Planctomycetota bacterium]|nr:SRPBCC family protein [Planctomycetota bacterium]
MSKPEFVYVTYIRTTLEKLWEALTKAEFTEQYWHGTLWKGEVKPGAEFDAVQRDGAANFRVRILECERPRKLVYTFKALSFKAAPDEAPSQVTYILEPDGEQVRMTLIHEKFPADSKVLPAIQGGWPGILASLKSLLETGKPLSMTSACGKRSHQAEPTAAARA